MRTFSKEEKRVMSKLAEECTELAAELLKACNKKYSPEMLQKIKDECDDVDRRMYDVELKLWAKKTLD